MESTELTKEQRLEIVYRHFINSLGGYSTSDIVAVSADIMGIEYNTLYDILMRVRKERRD